MKNVNIRQWLADFEPARVRAFIVALIGVAASIGYGEFATSLEPVAVAGIALIAAVSALLTGESARRKVFSPSTVEQLLNDQQAYIEDAPDPEADSQTVTDEEADELDLAAEDSDLDEDVDDALPDVSPEPGEHRAED